MGEGLRLAELEPVEKLGGVGLRRVGTELDERLYGVAAIREDHVPAFESDAGKEAAVVVVQFEAIGPRREAPRLRGPVVDEHDAGAARAGGDRCLVDGGSPRARGVGGGGAGLKAVLAAAS